MQSEEPPFPEDVITPDSTPAGEDLGPYPETVTYPGYQSKGEVDEASELEPHAEVVHAVEPRKAGLDKTPAARAHYIASELQHLESEVRGILSAVDDKHKRKLGGTSHWHELEDDIIAWRRTGRIPEADLTRLGQLVARRHHLFRQLSFLAGTRPTWNS